MAITCPVTWCDRLMPAARRVCGACTSETTRSLADIPDLAHQLDLALTRQTRLGSGSGPRGAEKPLPYDQHAREAAYVLHTTLAGWVRDLRRGVAALHGPACPGACGHATCTYITLATDPGNTTASFARWLLRHVRVLLGRDSAAEAVEELAEAVRQARRAIDRPAEHAYAGTCNQCGAGLYGKPGAREVACQACATPDGGALVYDIAERRTWMLDTMVDMRLPATDISRALTSLVRPIKPALLYTWVQRKKLQPAGHDEHGRALFRVGDVTDLMLSTTR